MFPSRAEVKALWSVAMINALPNKCCLYLSTAQTTASSSSSFVDCFLEYSGRYLDASEIVCCSNVAPKPVVAWVTFYLCSFFSISIIVVNF